jgi:hypothetical protein
VDSLRGDRDFSYTPALLRKPLPIVHVPPAESCPDCYGSVEHHSDQGCIGATRQRQLQADMQPENTLMFEGSPLKAGDILVDRDPPKLPGLAARIFRVADVDGTFISMLLLNRSDGSMWETPPDPVSWYVADVQEELKRESSASSGLTGIDQPKLQTHSASIGQLQSSLEPGDNQTCVASSGQVMFEGRPLAVGDRLVHLDTDPGIFGMVERIDGDEFLYRFYDRVTEIPVDAQPFRQKTSWVCADDSKWHRDYSHVGANQL